jgi:hypothetical protein
VLTGVTTIVTGKEAVFLFSWRYIMFQNTDYKVTTGCLPSWVTSVPPALIATDQSYYIPRLLVACFPARRPGFVDGTGLMGCVVDKAALRQVYFE